jgi:hypothetical protein
VTVPHTPRRAFSSPRAFHQVAGGMVVCTLTRRARFRVFRHTFHAKVFSVTRPIRSIAVFLVQVIRVGRRYEHHEPEPHEDVELFLVALECV